ncbi:hypothetical protein ILUMI_11067 [Ignelater luminosus]|uniref:Uncharacterized protein n=1 Tax=Ignelater luminosus TaxID=2038154 RepID=A0A8K0D5S0_IGNLU|nr:hypothetical protein ILUMI_11067 [Ignelater luminosus]
MQDSLKAGSTCPQFNSFYLRKPWVYNLGNHDCLTSQGYMYMRPENITKKGCDDIASVLYKHFEKNEIKN